MRFSHRELLLVEKSIYNVTIIMYTGWIRDCGRLDKSANAGRYAAREPAIPSTKDEWTRENERESHVNRGIQCRRKKKERRTKSGEVEKMIFNISNRLHLITQTVRASTCNSARGQPCASVHEHARSFDGFPFVRETESKVKKKKGAKLTE